MFFLIFCLSLSFIYRYFRSYLVPPLHLIILFPASSDFNDGPRYSESSNNNDNNNNDDDNDDDDRTYGGGSMVHPSPSPAPPPPTPLILLVTLSSSSSYPSHNPPLTPLIIILLPLS